MAGGTSFTGKQPNISNFPEGDFRLTTTKWDTITALTFNDRKLTKFDPSRVLLRMTALTTWTLHTNAPLVEDVSKWVFPSSIVTILFQATGVTGDVSTWAWSSLIATLRLDATGVTYGTGNALDAMTRNASTYLFNGCGMAAAVVNRILADCADSLTTGSVLNVAGNNAAPTGGPLNANYLTLVARGWAVTITA